MLGPAETERWSSLERRVERLEDDMSDVKSTLRSIEARLVSIEVATAEIKGKLQGLPTSWQMFTAIVTSAVATWSAGAAIVFTLLRFAPK
jgi:hypothetical protein